jgi:hypothetical protein
MLKKKKETERCTRKATKRRSYSILHKKRCRNSKLYKKGRWRGEEG